MIATNRGNSFSGFLALLTDGFILALFGLLTRYMSVFFANITQVSVRMILVVTLLLPILFKKKISIGYKYNNPLLFWTFILSFPLYIMLFTVSVNNIKVANAFFYIFIGSLITSFLIGAKYFSEKFDMQKMLVLILLVVGLFLFAYPFEFTSKSLVGITSGLLSGVLWGISNATRKLYADKMSNLLVIFYQMGSGALLCLILALLLSEATRQPLTTWGFIVLFIYAVGNIIVPSLLRYGFMHFNLDLGSVVLASQLIFVILLGVAFLNEVPTHRELMASIFVLAAVSLSKLEMRTLALKIGLFRA